VTNVGGRGRASPGYNELCTKKRSDFNAEGEFVVRSEGGRICCDFNDLSERTGL
jgi:hypothetical protein